MVGPWCFLDRFGPVAFDRGQAMDVPAHPHIGLQTVSWLLEGEVLHRDSLGYQAIVRPGGVNVMTAGRGIAHAESTPAANSARLSGVQLWVALPEAQRWMAPAFAHVEAVPIEEEPGGLVRVFAGSYAGAAVPASYYSKILGIDAQVWSGAALELALDPAFEHAALLLDGDCQLQDGGPAPTALADGVLYYLGARRTSLALRSQTGGRLLVIGGRPFGEKILMWWNFVARDSDEIAAARADWEAGLRFGAVAGERDRRLSAPELVRFARPNVMS
jgi:hypothetical protein